MRIALINEGTYPYGSGALGTWCQQLVRGLDEHSFWLVNLVEGRPAPAYPLPSNVARLTTVARAGPPAPPSGGAVPRAAALRQHRRLATHAAVLLCRGMLDDSAHSAAMFRSGLRRLTGAAADGTHPLVGVPLGAVLLDAWRASVDPRLPRPTITDADNAAILLERAVRPLTARFVGVATSQRPPAAPRVGSATGQSPPAGAPPDVDVCHVVHSGGSVLVALAAKWRTGIPYVLTEHDGYGGDPLLAAAAGHPAVQAVLHRFLAALTRLGNAEAAAVTPPDERMRRWALRHHADPATLRTVPPGIDPYDHPPLRDEPAGPVLAWLGEPDELPVALQAFERVRRAVPDARLIVIGATPDATRSPAGVGFSGPVTGYRALFAKATVLAMSGGCARMPYPLMEAMFCGRATVCTDLGDLVATVGAGARVVPPGDPSALAAACVPLLTDPRQRRALGQAARERARARFRLDTMLDSYREVYEKVAANPPEPAQRLAGTL